MVTKIAAILILGLSVLLCSLPFALAADEFPADYAWAGETVGQSSADLYVVAEAPNSPIVGESTGVGKLREFLAAGWTCKSPEAGESTHKKGKDETPPSESRLSACEIDYSVFDQSKKADRIN